MALVGMGALAGTWLLLAVLGLRSGLRSRRRVRDRRWDRAMATLRGCQGSGLAGPWGGVRVVDVPATVDVPTQREAADLVV